MSLALHTDSKKRLATRSDTRLSTVERPRKWSVRWMRSSGTSFCSWRLSCAALRLFDPNGFSSASVVPSGRSSFASCSQTWMEMAGGSAK